jgi:hypothetical protein
MEFYSISNRNDVYLNIVAVVVGTVTLAISKIILEG